MITDHFTEIAQGIRFYDSFLPDADELLAALRRELRVEQEHIAIRGRKIAMPRLTGWYGDPGAIYTYSGLRNEPKPWTPHLRALRERLEAGLGLARGSLNSCLVNVYRDGRDSMGWHADNEPELRGTIVSVSLGAPRTFQLREGWGNGPIRSIVLTHGSVLTMTVESQRRWIHGVPKETASGLRANLTFRTIDSSSV